MARPRKKKDVSGSAAGTKSNSAADPTGDVAPPNVEQPPNAKRKRSESEADYSSMEGEELRNILRARSLSPSGSKVDMVRRLELDDSAKAAGIPADEVRNEFQPKPSKRRKPTCAYPCPWPKETEKGKCPLTFETYTSSVRHVRTIHDPGYAPPRRKMVARLSKGTVPCPKAEEEKCDQKFMRWSDAVVHVRTQHHDPDYKRFHYKNPKTLAKPSKGTVPCPKAEEEKCDQKFTSLSVAITHVRTQHNDPDYKQWYYGKSKWLAKPSKGTVLCPKAEEEKCDQKFTRWSDAVVHVRTVHHDPHYKRLYYKESIMWPSEGPNFASSAKNSTLPPSFLPAEVERDGLSGSTRVPDPIAGKNVMSLQPGSWKQAEKGETSDSTFEPFRPEPSPMAGPNRPHVSRTNQSVSSYLPGGLDWVESETDDLEVGELQPARAKTAQLTEEKATSHAPKGLSVAERKMIPCPYREQYGCKKMYAHMSSAKRHGRTHSKDQKTWPCPLAKEFNCPKVCQSESGAKFHARSHYRKPWPCPLAKDFNCPKVFSRRNSAMTHAHVHGGWPRWVCTVPGCRLAISGAPRTELQMSGHWEKVHAAKGIEFRQKYPPRLFDANTAQRLDMLNEQMLEFFDSEHTEMQETPNEGATIDKTLLQSDTTFSDSHRQRIKDFNKSSPFLQRYEVVTTNNGCHCIGPSTTSYGMVPEQCPRKAIISFETAHLVHLPNTSYTNISSRCTSCHNYFEITKRLIKKGLWAGGRVVQCEHKDCFQQGWHGATRCQGHIFEEIRQVSRQGPDGLRARLSDSKQWTYQSDAFEKVLAGKDAYLLDLEFSSISRKVFEVGLCDYHPGEVLVDARIDHDCPDEELYEPSGLGKLKPGATYSYQLQLSKRFGRGVYGKDRQKCTNLRDVHYVATQIRESGITPDSILFVWHTNYFDLTLLVEWLAENGYHNLLPPRENCIRMVNLYRENLGEGCSLKLDLVFPMIFEGHALVGQNHRAVSDCQQLRLMVQLFEQLCKPASERDLSLLPDTNRSWIGTGKQGVVQQTLDRFVIQAKDQNGPADLLSIISEPAIAQEREQQQTINDTALSDRKSLEKESDSGDCFGGTVLGNGSEDALGADLDDDWERDFEDDDDSDALWDGYEDRFGDDLEDEYENGLGDVPEDASQEISKDKFESRPEDDLKDALKDPFVDGYEDEMQDDLEDEDLPELDSP